MEKAAPQMTIRKAEHDDCADVSSIAQTAYAVYLSRMTDKPFPMLDDYAKHIRQGRVYVLEAGSLVCGYVVLIIKNSDTLLLDNIAVRPEDKGSGYGRKLVQFAEEWGRKHKCTRICLYTNEVMTENLGWYERLGYFITHHASEGGYQRIYMAKDL